MKRILLKAGASRATLAPDVGGSLASLVLGGHEILRAGPEELQAGDDPRNFSEFPMAPWVNRVAGGRFTWNGREINVAATPGEDPQALHGIAWRLAWSVLENSDNAASLGVSWDGSAGWPFAFRLVRRFTLTPAELSVEATISNMGADPMPMAIGFHPYFPARGAVLNARTEAGWSADANGIPSCTGLLDAVDRMRAGHAIESAELDNCFTGWDGEALIQWPRHALRLTTEPPLGFLQVYAPREAGYFCVEPQSAMPDALNRDPDSGGLRVLGGGQAHTVTMRLELQ